MVSPPSLESIQAAYENKQPAFVSVVNGVVEIKDSDGDASCLPPDGELVVSQDNTIDVLAEAEWDVVRRWLDKIGNYLMHEGNWYLRPQGQLYSLNRFPAGYKLYTHRTGDKTNPRKDSYLHGSTTDRCNVFRSPEEFALHAKWLAFGRPTDDLNRPLCACCYCSKTPQGGITVMLKKKTDHLQTSRSTSRSASGGRGVGHGHAKSHAPVVPIIAKDYTRLNRGEGVSTWKENELPPSREQ